MSIQLREQTSKSIRVFRWLSIVFLLLTVAAAPAPDRAAFMRDEERYLNERIRQLTAEGDEAKIALDSMDPESPSPEARARIAELERRLRSILETKRRRAAMLQDLRQTFADEQNGQLQHIFQSPVDVYLDAAKTSEGTATIAGARCLGITALAGRPLLELNAPSGTWFVDPEKIIAIRVQPSTQPARETQRETQRGQEETQRGQEETQRGQESDPGPETRHSKSAAS